MITSLSHHRPRRPMATRRAGARLGRLAAVLAAVISGLLGSAAAAAAAEPIPVGNGTSPLTPVPATLVRVSSTGGLAVWQVALNAAGAALTAAAAAVLLDRKLGHRRAAATA